MEHEYQYCGALRLKKENSRMYSLEGKVNLLSYLYPSEILKDLWFGDGKIAEVFRNNARVLINTIY